MSNDPQRPAADPPTALPRGTRLGEFELLHVLGIGGFGIVYLAFDHALEREVAIKEYMPASLAGRTETLHVSLRSQSDSDTFSLGLRSFVNEAKLLARFDHPSLVKVHRFWEANGTAYMAMPVYRGRTLKQVRQEMAAPPDEAWLRAMLDPLLGAIERLHGEGVYHRDIAPDNIQIEADGRPVLLDFGAARRVISDKSQALTAILKPAYAPIEQYGEAGSVKQGPWTDLYALGATLHYMLLGRPPAPATARAVHDDVQPLGAQALPGCSPGFLQTIDWMLAPRPTDRPQSVEALRDVLDGRVAVPQRLAAPAAPQADWERTQAFAAAPAVPRTEAPAAAGDGDRTVVRPVRPTAPVAAPSAPVAAPPVPSMAPPPAAPPPRSTPWPAFLGGGVVVALVAGAWFFWPAAAPAPVPVLDAAPVVAAPAPALASAPVPEPARAVIATPPPAVQPVPQPAAGPASPLPASAAARPSPRPVVTARPAPAKPAASAPVIETKVAQPDPPVTAPAIVPPTSVPAQVPAPQPAARIPTPADRCGSRLLVALWRCMERECKTPELRAHPECVKWKAEQEKRPPDDSTR